MNNKLSVLGGVIGSAIIFPAALSGVVTMSMSSIFSKGGDAAGMKISLALSVITMIGSLCTLPFTVMNYLNPENELKKVSSIIVLVTGVFATGLVVYLLVKAFSIWFLFGLLAAAAVLVSGLIQMAILKL